MNYDAYSCFAFITDSVNGVTVNPFAYRYDRLNRAISRNDDTFGYNARSEVTAANIASSGYGYAYDFIGNRTTSSINSVEKIYDANNLNQYLQLSVPSEPSVENLTYDPDGNMVSNGAWSYTWDAENRLVSAFSNSVCVVSNAYDHMSRRVLKVTPEAMHTFLYDGWNLVQETIANVSDTVTNTYVWGKDLSGTMQGAGGVGGLLAVNQDNAWYFPCYDNNGNITAYVDEQGSVVAEYTYDAFGKTIIQSGSMANVFRHRFSTKYYEPETGLYYYGYRFYSPELHRWLNRDPIEEDGGMNLYSFCRNDGLNRLDAFGMSPSPVVLEEIASVVLSFAFGDRIIHEAAFMFHGGRKEFINETGRQLYARGVLAGKMWDRSLSEPSLNHGKLHGNTLVITSENQTQWGSAIDLIQSTSNYKEKVAFIKRRLKEGTSAKGFVNIEFNTPDALASSIHGAQLHYNCSECKLILTIQDEYNFDKKHMWWRLQKEGYIIPYNVIIAMPNEKCGGKR